MSIGLNNRLDINWLRGLAAIFVVFSHILFFSISQPDKNVIWTIISPLFNGGHAAVELFFVLSGFLIPLSLVSCDYNLKTYFWHRAKRILPLFWFMCLMLFIVFMPLFRWHYKWITIPIHFLGIQSLVPIEVPGLVVLNPMWTLTIEISFYALLPFIWKRFNKNPVNSIVNMFFIAFVWRIFCALIDHKLNLLTSLYLTVQLPGQLFEFSMGMGLASLYIRGWKLNKKANEFWIELLFIVLVYSYTNNYMGLGYLLATVSCGVILFLSVFYHQTNSLIKKWLSKIGVISYSIYLWHVPVIFMVNRFLDLNFWSYCITTLIFTGVISIYSYNYIEKPFLFKN